VTKERTWKLLHAFGFFYNGVELSNDIAKLPKTVKQNKRSIDFNEYPINYLSQSPNDMMTAFWLLEGECCLVITSGATLIRECNWRIEALIHLDSDDALKFFNNRLYYVYKMKTIPSDEMLHFKHLSFDGIVEFRWSPSRRNTTEPLIHKTINKRFGGSRFAMVWLKELAVAGPIRKWSKMSFRLKWPEVKPKSQC
jgi:hypothetical protein